MNIFKKIFGNSHNDIGEETKMTNTQKALELINTFATGNTEKAAELLAEGYIQHNLAYATGPVSYTHLDVYKRQPVFRQFPMGR